ncbi:hypothetical protein [Enorma sp.]|uniref:hypothetical protein n=1 Tax=Enorma sp. TaxID=1920692 RepID=UPI0025BA75F1|nr:hypothetical protein [Enorma sp.]
MMLESYPWKRELERQIEDLESLAKPGAISDDCADEVDFQFERSLIYSAFISRLLMDAGKLPDSVWELQIVARTMPLLDSDFRNAVPVLRRWPDNGRYDFASEEKRRLSFRDAINQIIHSAIIPTMALGKERQLEGFFVGSDRVFDTEIYYISLEDWLAHVCNVLHADVSNVRMSFDPNKGTWIVSRD